MPTIFGYGSAIVVSGSMRPNLNVGDYVIVKEEDVYHEGDIVIYIDNDNSMVAHRIIKKRNRGLITKGDNNNTGDEPITKNQIKGKVVLVLRTVGMIQIILSKPVSIMIILLLMIIISMMYFRKKGDNDGINN